MVEVLSWLLQQVVIGDWKVFVYNIIQAILIIVVGFIVGRIVKFLFSKLADKAGLRNTIKPSFVDLFLAVIKWTIYIFFLEIAFEQLEVPQISEMIRIVLLAIPAIVGALFLIAIGFVIASYLKDIIEESRIINWQILSNLVFYFILYIFSIFAVKTALHSLDTSMTNIIIVILTAVISVTVAFYLILNFSWKKK